MDDWAKKIFKIPPNLSSMKSENTCLNSKTTQPGTEWGKDQEEKAKVRNEKKENWFREKGPRCISILLIYHLIGECN